MPFAPTQQQSDQPPCSGTWVGVEEDPRDAGNKEQLALGREPAPREEPVRGNAMSASTTSCAAAKKTRISEQIGKVGYGRHDQTLNGGKCPRLKKIGPGENTRGPRKAMSGHVPGEMSTLTGTLLFSLEFGVLYRPIGWSKSRLDTADGAAI